MTMVSIRQPGYLPYVGFFKKIQSCDIFVYLDDVQYERGDWDNRNQIKTSDGSLFLTVPIHNKLGQKLKDAKIVSTHDWQKKHLEGIKNNYQRCDYFSTYWDDVSSIISNNWEKLIDLNLELIEYFNKKLDLQTKTVRSSSFDISNSGSEKLLKICQKLNASIYLSGELGKNYLDEDLFNQNNIDVIFEKFQHPVYTQRFDDFIPNMTILDLLFNEGENSKKIIQDSKNQ